MSPAHVKRGSFIYNILFLLIILPIDWKLAPTTAIGAVKNMTTDLGQPFH